MSVNFPRRVDVTCFFVYWNVQKYWERESFIVTCWQRWSNLVCLLINTEQYMRVKNFQVRVIEMTYFNKRTECITVKTESSFIHPGIRCWEFHVCDKNLADKIGNYEAYKWIDFNVIFLTFFWSHETFQCSV